MKRMVICCVFFVSFGLIAFAGGSGEASAEGAAESPSAMTVTDMRGKEIIIPSDPRRVVIIDKGFIAQVMRTLGVEDRIVATGGLLQTGTEQPTDRDTLFLCPSITELPNVGYTFGGFDYEALAAARPDLVLWRNSEYIKDNEITLEAMEKIEKGFGIPLVVINGPGCYDVPSLETHYEGIRVLGEVFSRQDEADSLVQYLEEQIDLVRRRTADIPEEEKPSVLYIGLRTDGGVGVVWGGTFGDAKFSREVAHIKNAYPEQDRQMMSAEHLIDLDPEVIILATNSVTPNPDILFDDPAYETLASISAVRNRRVTSLGLLTWWGDFRLEFPTILLIAAKSAYPGRFEDIQVHQWLEGFHGRLYDLDADEAAALAGIQGLDWMSRREF